MFNALFCVYCFTTVIGLFANTLFAYTLYTSRVPRNVLVVALMLSDAAVCAISSVLKSYRLLLKTHRNSLMNIFLFEFIEQLPTSFATLSMMSLAIDRYLMVKKFQPLNRESTRKKTLPYVVASIWSVAVVLVGLQTVAYYNNFSWFHVVKLLRIVFVNIMPTVVVLVSHVVLYVNLTAVSLTARARHGELPLPMPIIRSKRSDDKNSFIIISAVSKPECEEMKIEEVAEEEEQERTPTTLSSRKRLGQFMIVVALCFFFLWTPYTISEILNMFLINGIDSQLLSVTECLACMHSAVSPILSLSTVDRDWNKELACMCCNRVFKEQQWSPSSTNEDALGPFNPRYARPVAQRVQYNRRSSSIFIY